MEPIENFTIIKPEAEFYFIENQNLVLVEIQNLEENVFTLTDNLLSTEEGKTMFFEDNNVSFCFKEQGLQFTVDLKEHPIEKIFLSGKNIGFSFLNKQGVPCNNVAIFKYEN